jgi:hypothetical protein
MSILLDQFDTHKPELMPPSPLPAAAAVIVAVTTNIANPSAGVLLQDGATVQGHVLSAEANDVVLLLGQNDPAENGFWRPAVSGAERVVGATYFSDHIGPSGEDGHYKQFKVAVTGGTNAGKTYFLATPPPALFEDGLRFYELTITTPIVMNTGNWDLTPPEVLPLGNPPFVASYVCKVAVNDNQALPLAPGPITLDGVDLANGDYYLLKGQEEQTENGVFKVAADGQVKARTTGLVRALIAKGTNKGKQFSADQETGVVTSLAPGLHP